MTTDPTLEPGTTCYECGGPFTPEQWDAHHDQHPDWCLVEPGAYCDCDETYSVHDDCCFACNGQLFADPHARERGHRFYPRRTVLEQIPSLYKTERQPIAERVVYLHYFTGSADWWIVELDESTGTAFGYACLGDAALAEWGGIYLPEMADLFIPFKLVPPNMIRPRRLLSVTCTGRPRRPKTATCPGEG